MIVDADEAAEEAAAWRSTCSEDGGVTSTRVVALGDLDWANPCDGYGNQLDLHAAINHLPLP
jgi:hypothetical protein